MIKAGIKGRKKARRINPCLFSLNIFIFAVSAIFAVNNYNI